MECFCFTGVCRGCDSECGKNNCAAVGESNPGARSSWRGGMGGDLKGDWRKMSSLSIGPRKPFFRSGDGVNI
jgi:hypothetical protein